MSPKFEAEEIPLIRPEVGGEELEEIGRVLQSGWLAQGPEVKKFEKEIEVYLGAKHAVATSSCTTALSLAIEALGLSKAGQVIIPDFTFPATANVAVLGGMDPILADISDRSYAIAPSEAAKAAGEQTQALMPVHPFGHPFEMDEIYELARKNGLEVIEDAATAFGARYKGRKVGHRGRAVCFSFHPRKLITTAEGGCLVTDDDEVYEKAKILRNHGQVIQHGRAKFVTNGWNYRMSDIHAAIGLAQLRKLDRILEKRRKQAQVYEELLVSARLDIRPPLEQEWGYHTYQSYVTMLGESFPSRDECIDFLKEKHHIETQIGTYSISMQPAFKSLPRSGELRNSRKVYRRSLTLPLYNSLTEEQQMRVIDAMSQLPSF